MIPLVSFILLRNSIDLFGRRGVALLGWLVGGVQPQGVRAFPQHTRCNCNTMWMYAYYEQL